MAPCNLPGHGGSAPLPRVSFGALAAAVAEQLPQDEPVVVPGCGHGAHVERPDLVAELLHR